MVNLNDRSVIVQGFDHGTTDAQIKTHMSSVGTVQKFEWINKRKGVACVTYSVAIQAKAANMQLQKSTIAGNQRFIDVIPLDPEEFLSGHNVEPEKVTQFYSLTPEQQEFIITKGPLGLARDVNAVLGSRILEARKARFGAAKCSSLGSGHHVLVQGFDFNTSLEQIGAHMSTVGTIQNIQQIDQEIVCITYSSKQQAKAAGQQLQGTTIPGNSRFIEVIVLDPEDFLKGVSVDADKAAMFRALSPDQQKAVMAQGRLVNARDPTAVLVTRMVKVTGQKLSGGGGGGKGSFGPAKGKGFGKGGMRSGPYGGGGDGGMGFGGGGMGNQQLQEMALGALLGSQMRNQQNSGGQNSMGMNLIQMGLKMMMNQKGNKW